MKPPTEWPVSIPPSRTATPNGVAVMLLAEEGLKFFKLSFHAVLSFTDYPYTLSIVNQNCGIESTKFYQAMAVNHGARIYPAMRDADLLLSEGFSDPRIRYVCLLHSDVIVEPMWLSSMVARLEEHDKNGFLSASGAEFDSCVLVKRPAWEHITRSGRGDFKTMEGIGRQALQTPWGILRDPDIRVHHFGVCRCDHHANKGERHAEARL